MNGLKLLALVTIVFAASASAQNCGLRRGKNMFDRNGANVRPAIERLVKDSARIFPIYGPGTWYNNETGQFEVWDARAPFDASKNIFTQNLLYTYVNETIRGGPTDNFCFTCFITNIFAAPEVKTRVGCLEESPEGINFRPDYDPFNPSQSSPTNHFTRVPQEHRYAGILTDQYFTADEQVTFIQIPVDRNGFTSDLDHCLMREDPVDGIGKCTRRSRGQGCFTSSIAFAVMTPGAVDVSCVFNQND